MDPMAKGQDQTQQTETDRMIGDVVIYGLIGMIGILFFIPALLGMLIFAVLHMFKREWFFYVGLGSGFLILLWQFQTGMLLTYFGLISEMNIPYLSTGSERLLNNGNPISVSASSYWVLMGLSFLFSFGFFIFAKFFWKRRVKTKSGEVQKQKAQHRYKTFRKNRVKFLENKQHSALGGSIIRIRWLKSLH
ncbi:hypothetical protein [Bacillus sp. SJS]|uniref:hypothetical protein n=1 Tax=Bacillus sp. SJS TaxID=1423321 RepID=UPI0004DCB412|nr:hypothetical protein [Bacillus sp. SJS]KZZ85188.1 hypothetical protein AS29_006880 [Bacillus sp. SJS]